MKNLCEKCNEYRDTSLYKGKMLCSNCLAEIAIDQDIRLKKSENDKFTDLNLLAKECHEQALKSGFYDKELDLFNNKHLTQKEKDYILQMSIATKLMLIVSELGEKLEAMRNNKKADLKSFEKSNPFGNHEKYRTAFKKYVKDSAEDEISDTLIRIFDLAGYMNVDVNKHVEYKRTYNAIRCEKEGLKHGKLF